MSASLTGGVLGALVPHFLLPTGILRKQMKSEPDLV